MGSKERVSAWTVVGTILIILSIVFLVFCHAYPYWWQVEETRNSGFGIPNSGLWEICFDEEGAPAPPWAGDDLGKRYYKCNYVFDRDLREIREWYFPDWFIVVAFAATLGLMLQPLVVIFNIMYYVRVCSPHYEHLLILVSFLIQLVNGFLLAMAIIIFGIKSNTDQEWMPDPKSYHLSYSYAMCAVVPVLCFLAAMCHCVEFLRLKSYKDRNARAQVYARGEFSRY